MLVRLKQLGCTPIQVQITIDLKDLTLTKEQQDISLVCVEFKRGSKTITTGSKLVPEGDKVIRFDESLCLLMTLYRSASGQFLEKKGRLVVVGHSKSTRTAVILGSIDLNLDRLAGNFARQSLSLSLGFAHLGVVVIPKYLGSGMVDADNSSLMSGEDGASSIMRSRMNSSESHQHDMSFAAVYRDPTERLFMQERPQRLQFSEGQSATKAPASIKSTISPTHPSPDEQIAQLEAKLSRAQMQVTTVEAEKREILERQSHNNSIDSSNAKSGLVAYSTPNKPYPTTTSSHNNLTISSVSKLSPKAAQLMSMSGKKPNTLTSSASRRSSQQQQQQQPPSSVSSSQRNFNTPEGSGMTAGSNERVTPFSPGSSQRSSVNSNSQRTAHRDAITNESPSSQWKMTLTTTTSPPPSIINDSLVASYTQQLRDTKSKEDLRALFTQVAITALALYPLICTLEHTLFVYSHIYPLTHAIVITFIIVSCHSYKPSYLFNSTKLRNENKISELCKQRWQHCMTICLQLKYKQTKVSCVTIETKKSCKPIWSKWKHRH